MSWKKKPYKPPSEVNDNLYIPEKKPTKPITMPKKSADFIKRDFAQKQKILEKINKVKEKRGKVKKEDKRHVLMINDYMRYLKNTYPGMEIHHWMPKGRIKQNDFFVIPLTPADHHEIHHGKSTVNRYIESIGMAELVVTSLTLFAKWMATDEGRNHRYKTMFVSMIREIHLDPTYEVALEITRKYAEEIRILRRR